MAEVIYTLNAQQQIKDLIQVLYEKEYFGFLQSAKDYAADILNFCDRIPRHRRLKTKDSKHGEWYCRYSHNRRTHWFIIFDIKDDRYIIRHIINNFSSDYPQFVSNI